jgi:hypothetical protein
MRRTLIALALLVAVGSALTAASMAQASVGWPARCTNMKCVNAHLNNLNKRTTTLRTRVLNDESFDTLSTVCEGDALVNETQNETDNATGITGEVGPIAAALHIDCSTAFWPLFDPANFPRPVGSALHGTNAFRAALINRLK